MTLSPTPIDAGLGDTPPAIAAVPASALETPPMPATAPGPSIGDGSRAVVSGEHLIPGGDHPIEDLAALTRPDFPLLDQTACLGQPLIYLDYAATSQKPRQVLEALQHYYGHDNANVHRGAHQLSARATEGFEHARDKVAQFVGAASAREIVYTRNASEAINLVARSEEHTSELSHSSVSRMPSSA